MDVEPNPGPLNVGALVGWPVVVALLLPPTQVALGPDRGDVVSLVLVALAAVMFARYGFLGVLRTECGTCGDSVPVGGLYCPHCGSLRSSFAAPLIQTLLAVLVLPYGWFVVVGLTSRVLLVAADAEPALSLYGTFYSADVGGTVEVSAVLALSVWVAVGLTAAVKVAVRVTGRDRLRASESGS